MCALTFTETVFRCVNVEVLSSRQVRDQEGDHVESRRWQVLHGAFGPLREAERLRVVEP